MKLGFLTALVVTTSLTSTAFAVSRVKTACYLDPQGVVKGTNPDSMTEIASVSKLLTAHWMISKLGPHARIGTRINLTPVSEGVVDLHIEGALDPSFNVNRMAVLAGHLNSIGVTHVRNLTFDQNFRYRSAVYSGAQVAGDPNIHILTKEQIVPLLRATVQNIKTAYSRAIVGSETHIDENNMPDSVKLAVDDINFLNSEEFKKTAETKTYISQSVEVYEIIKQMNMKSNNYIANILFDHMGGEEAYRKFIKENKNYTLEQIDFANGSGYPVREYRGGGRKDNKATCRAVVTIVKDLRDKMKEHDMNLANVVAVAGGEPRGSTVDGAYKTDLTEDALVAKTGTSDPVVALAGLASTKQGNVYFAVVVADGRAGGRASSGRIIIRQQVESIFRQYGGSDDINYSAESFFEVDDMGKLQLQKQALTVK